MVKMAAMEITAAGHATNVTAHATHVNTSHATDVASAEAAAHATDVAAAEAATTRATAMTAAASTPAPAAYQRQRTAPRIPMGVAAIARLRERRRGGEGQRKSANETESDDAAFHDCIPLLLM
jgi:hypothetical protein